MNRIKKVMSLLLIFCFTMQISICTFANAIKSYEESPFEKGFDQSVEEFVSGITAGWNLGNTFDSYNSDMTKNYTPKEIETYWGNPETTKEMIKMVKDAGFNAIRIPITWQNFTGEEPDYGLDQNWIARIKEIVDYAIDLDMYVIINVHHDGDVQNENAWISTSKEQRELSYKKLNKIWWYVGSTFKDYPVNLMFEGFNEVRESTDNWNGSEESRRTITDFSRQFRDTVRATGGNNGERFLIFKTYGAMADDVGLGSGFTVPKPTDNRMLLSVHMYETNTPEDMYKLKQQINRLKTNFVDKGIPVIIGEWGMKTNRNNLEENIKTRTEHAEQYVALAEQNGIKTFVWDDGGEYILLDRRNLEWRFPTIVEGIQKGLGNSKYVHKWASEKRIDWGNGDTPVYNDDGSINIKWSGKKDRQVQYVEQLNSDITKLMIQKAKEQGKNLEFTVTLNSIKNEAGSNYQSAEFMMGGGLKTDSSWINLNQEKTFIINPNDISISNLEEKPYLHLIIQNYSVPSISDVEVSISPIKIAE